MCIRDRFRRDTKKKTKIRRGSFAVFIFTSSRLVIVRIAFIAVIRCFIVWTLKHRLHVAVSKGGFSRGRKCDNSYHSTKKWIEIKFAHRKGISNICLLQNKPVVNVVKATFATIFTLMCKYGSKCGFSVTVCKFLA